MAPERPGLCVEGEAGAAVPGQQRPAVPVPVVLHAHQLKEGDGAVRCVDDDLTSLTWLQDKNLLKGINLRGGGVTQGSPTSDYVDEGSCCSTSEPADSGGSSGGQSPSPAATSPPLARLKHPQHVPYDPQVHTSSKPPYSFSCLIFMAIEDSPQRALPVKEIYAWILEHFPYFKNAPTGWKNSVRHNLSLNKCFRKVEKAPNLGKGSLWMVDPMYRPNLLQALSKSPFHPYSSQSGRQSSGSSTPAQSPTKPSILRGGGRQPSTASCDNLPDPVLFPYLSRRLAQAGEDGEESPDDVDAATAMLALKHGHRAGIHRRDDWYKRLRENSEEGNSRKKMRTSKGSQDNFASKIKIEEPGDDQAKAEATEGMVITTSPSEDHTYSAALNLSAKAQQPSSSPDEAFEEGTDSEEDGCRPCLHADMVKCELDEEQRKIAEGADALLNLAGIATVHSRGKLGQHNNNNNNNNTIAVNNNKLERSQQQVSAGRRKGGQSSGRLRKKPLPQRRVRGGGKR